MKKLLLLFIVLSGLNLYASNQNFVKIDSSNNITSVAHAVRVIKAFYGPMLYFENRYFFMNTNNANSMGFYANGFNSSLYFQSHNLLNLSRNYKVKNYRNSNYVGIFAGYSHLSNLGSSNLEENNRYEIGLFDIQNPANKQMGQLTKLHVFGTLSNIKFNIGRFTPGPTPFINNQDGRLRPTFVQGINVEYKRDSLPFGIKATAVFNLANQILARGSNDWKSINQTIGLYPMGLNIYGKNSNYSNSIRSNNVLLFPSLSLSKTKERKALVKNEDKDSFYLIKTLNVDLNYNLVYLNTLFTTQMIELTGKSKLNRTKSILNDDISTLSYGLMWIHQKSNAVNSDTNYIEASAKSNVFSAFLSAEKELGLWLYQFTLATTRITKDGRYLMPREWGRDPFYTFMARERNEGFGDLTAWTIDAQISRRFRTNKYLLRNISYKLGFGNYKLPDVKNYVYNKYGMPSYQQLNTMVSMNFIDKRMKNNLSIQVWYVQKFNAGNTYNQLKYEQNKVNMNQLNIILNYSLNIY